MKYLLPSYFYKITLLILTFFAVVPPGYATPNPTDAFNRLLEEEWNFRVQHNPFFASSIGVHDYDDLLPEITEESLKQEADFLKQIQKKLQDIDRSQLGAEEQVTYDIFQYELADRIADFRFKTYLIPITADAGFHVSFSRLPRNTSFRSVTDYDNYIKRLSAFPSYMNQQISMMKKGMATGMTLPKVVLTGFESTITAHVVNEADSSVFYQPFLKLPQTMPETERKRLKAVSEKVIMEQVVPAYQQFADFMVGEYIPNARTTIGAADLPNGKAYYEQRVQFFSTLNMTSQEVHDLGLAEVKRIRQEMEKIIEEVGFKGSFADFLNFLRTDPQFYVTTPEALLKEASFIAKSIDAKLPAYFGKLPRQPYGVQAVPASIAPKYTGGRYVESPIDSKEPGYYWVNTYKLESRPLYVLESLTLHEAVPGHHLQIALSQEMGNLPKFRQYLYISAFGEGWGLYSEFLGKEMGFYTNPYSDFGRLTYEMWRACRLVVDTGIHDMHWSREQVLDYLASNTALSLHEVETETDRYIAVPGQAISYKIGELKIRELRGKAEKALGQQFDIREFHDEVLGNGAVTLTVLEKIIDEYISAKLEENPAESGE